MLPARASQRRRCSIPIYEQPWLLPRREKGLQPAHCSNSQPKPPTWQATGTPPAHDPSQLTSLHLRAAHIAGTLGSATVDLLITVLPLPIASFCFCPQEEERERRMDYIPDESAINTDAIEVGAGLLSSLCGCWVLSSQCLVLCAAC